MIQATMIWPQQDNRDNVYVEKHYTCPSLKNLPSSSPQFAEGYHLDNFLNPARDIHPFSEDL